MLDEQKLHGQIVNEPESEFTKEDLERFKESDARAVLKRVLYSKDGVKFLTAFAECEDSVRNENKAILYGFLRSAFADSLKWPKHNNLRYLDENEVEDFFPDDFIAKLIIEHIDRLGFSAPEGSDKLKEFLANQ